MVVGEGPGETEDIQGVPFVGAAGKMLDNLLRRAGLDRNQIYITNIVKCRPPGNRDPEPDEVAACWSYLRDQIQEIRPGVIVTLGKPATQRITSRFGTMGSLLECGDLMYEDGDLLIPVIAAYHPSYLLRAAQGQSERAKALLLEAINRLVLAKGVAE